ncbi:MFS transporter [Ruania halotolerans]|uniref:MFS transporter n=1 Tax=Ruania halotolerans TaxID=2897773 RepID=UPI001E3E4F9D|nr:MFS transporter [Ruania halotolerans]UFU07475.1 MFS transporter [Ruania halotolerans]
MQIHATASAGRQATKAGAAAWVGLGVLSVPIFMTAVDMSVLFLAIPTIAADLLPSGTQQLWVLHIGDIAGASLVLTAGRLVDQFGPRRLLMLGLVGYALASSLAALAPTIEVLILARMLLGASAVTIAPAGAALLRSLFPLNRQFSVAIALFMAAFSGGMALGPPLGGLVLEHFWWGAIFLFNVPIAIGVVGLWWLLPKVDGNGSGRIDGLSIALSALGIAGLVYGGQELAAGGWSPWHALAVVAGVSLMAAFIRRQRTLDVPMLDLSLFRSVPLTLALISIWLVITAGAGADMQFAQHLQVVMGHGPLGAGMLLVVPALFSMGATAASPILLRWLRPGFAIGAGAGVAVVGAALMVVAVSAGPEASIVFLIGAACLVAIGMAPVFAIGTTVVLANAPPAQTGSAQGMQEVSGSLGNTAGLALGGSVAYVSYSGAMSVRLPAGLDKATAHQSVESVGGALAGAAHLPPDAAALLVRAITESFTVATRDTYFVAVLGFAVAATLAFVGLRTARIDGDEGETPTAGTDEATAGGSEQLTTHRDRR